MAVALAVFAAGAAHAGDQGADASSGQTAPPSPAAVPAAPNDTNTVQEVVVTGFRNSLARAIDIKKNADSEVDTILAEDIGKFPDLNLADSLQRIPGVTISRENGEGRQITVRGLGPQYTRVLINGMEALATVGSPDNDGGVNRTRSFDFNVFSSDLFNSLTVRKTAEGNLEEGSLGATIEMRSAHPFDFAGFKFIANMKEDHNTLANSTQPRASMLISDTWDDGHWGALLSLSYSKRNFLDTGASTVRWDEGNVLSTGGTSAAPLVGFGSVLGTNCQVFPLPTACVATDSALHPRFPRYDYYTDTQTRLGLSGSLQWKPDDNNLFTLDYLHSLWYATRQEQYLEAPGFSGTGKCTNVNTCTSIANIKVISETIQNGVLTAGTFNGVDMRVEDRYDEMHTNFNQITLKGEHRFSDKFSVDELIGGSLANFMNPIQTTLGFDQFNIQNFSYDFGTRIPKLNFGSANLSASGPWVLTSVRERPQSDDNDFYTGQINAHYVVNDDLTFSGGLSFKEYRFQTTSFRLVNGESVTSSNVYKNLQLTPISQISQLLNFSNAINIPGGSSTTSITPDVFKAAQVFGLYTNPLFALSITPDLGNNARATEKDYGVWGQADFKFNLLDRPVTGNLGLRDVKTDQFTQGFSFVSSVLRPTTSNRSYSDFLPSLNLAWHWSDDFLVRFGAARVMTRPNLTDLLASTSISVSGTQFNVKTGNPGLKPFLANSYDLSFEWYPSHGSMLSLALFHKDIDSLITTQVFNIPFHGNPFGIPDSAAVAACGSTPGCSPSANWQFSVPTNTSGGGVNGLEINYQQPFTSLPGLWSHTGLLLNGTYVDSSVKYPTSTTGVFVTNQLLGLSRYAANATIYYEDSKWMVRVSGAYRTKYLIQVPGKEIGTNADGFDAAFNLDTSIQYTINDHLKMSLEGINLTDQYENEFNDTGHDLPYYYHHTGREILFGIRYQY
jgi:TonB-dependent receptor